ncbi:ankyrinankyrin-1 [Octopus vulgaris]|uniref:Ankyrinankyrin-1 n=1 Tax=Octopus vulgaris TaxID=6645 RepID=A0AA36HHD1_OCTVU|nr:ankyrinankyrin-1 [Octopus vulgaris]
MREKKGRRQERREKIKVNPRNEYGQTPLHWACSLGHLHTVDILLGHNGIDANVVDNDGDTPLHKAVQRTTCKTNQRTISKVFSLEQDIRGVKRNKDLTIEIQGTDGTYVNASNKPAESTRNAEELVEHPSLQETSTVIEKLSNGKDLGQDDIPIESGTIKWLECGCGYSKQQ